MKDFIKKNFAILLAFLLPILLIIIVTISVYLPSLFIKTNYNFIYSSCMNNVNYYSYDNCNNYLHNRYSVMGDTLTLNSIDTTQDLNKDGILDYKEKYFDRIFFHDTEKNESREITLDEAKKLKLSSLLTSPDGVSISENYNRSGDSLFVMMIGGERSSYGHYLTKGKGRSRINLINDNNVYYYQNNFQFLGWVLPGRNDIK